MVLKRPLSDKLWMSLSLYLRSFFGPTAELQDLLASRCSPAGGPGLVLLCPYKKRRLGSRHIHRGTPAQGHSRKDRHPRRNQLCQHLDPGLLASRTVRKYISVVLSHPMYSTFLLLLLLLAFAAAAAKSLQSCPTLCDPIDGSPPGSAVPGILQARTLEWVAISFSNA